MIIHHESHLDHDLTGLDYNDLLRQFKDRKEFFIETVSSRPVRCYLHGPIMGDDPIPESEVTYLGRGSREGRSRICKRQSRLVEQITVIAGPHGDYPCVLYTAFGGPQAPGDYPCVLYTAFGGPQAPKEVFEDDSEENKAFWAEHALSLD